jgi:hypothetical protein
LGGGKNEEKVDPLYFFVAKSSSRQKKRILTEVVRKANRDQKTLVERASQSYAQT